MPARTTSRLRRGAIASAAAIALTVGITGAAAAPANAATAYGHVTVCFAFPGGIPYQGDTYSYKWDGANWNLTTRAPGTADGCRRWSVADQSYVLFLAWEQLGDSSDGMIRRSEFTDWAAAATGSEYNLGTYEVKVTDKWSSS